MFGSLHHARDAGPLNLCVPCLCYHVCSTMFALPCLRYHVCFTMFEYVASMHPCIHTFIKKPIFFHKNMIFPKKFREIFLANIIGLSYGVGKEAYQEVWFQSA